MTTKKLLDCAHDFSRYGILAEPAAKIYSDSNRIWKLINTGKRNTAAFDKACVARDASESRLFDIVGQHTGDLSFDSSLLHSLKHSARYGLLCPNIVADVFHTYRDNVDGATQVGTLLHNCEITRFTTEGCWSNFDETIEGLMRSGWNICGMHKLPERYTDYYGKTSRTIVFRRSIVCGYVPEWED